MKIYEVSEEKEFVLEGTTRLSIIRDIVTSVSKSFTKTGDKGVDVIADLQAAFNRNNPIKQKGLPLQAAKSINIRIKSLEALADEYKKLDEEIIKIQNQLRSADPKDVLRMERNIDQLTKRKESTLKLILTRVKEIREIQSNPTRRLFGESKKNLKEMGVTSILIKWFQKRGAKFTDEQINSIELHHSKYNRNEQLINKLTAESNAGENIDFKKLDRLQKEQEILKQEITRIGKDGIEKGTGIKLKDSIEESNLVLDQSSLRSHIISMIAQKIGETDDIDQLAEWLKMIVGKELKPRGSRYIISSEDIKDAFLEAHGNSKIYDKCWKGYKKVLGKKRGEKGSCVKEDVFEAVVDIDWNRVTTDSKYAYTLGLL